MEKSDTLETALEGAKIAEEIIRKDLRGELDVNEKKDGTPVTASDVRIESELRELIKKRHPEHEILGEEKGGSLNPDKMTWVLDPIDGTKRYVRKIPTFGTLIALMHKGEVVMGVSSIPLLNELMWAEKGKGAYLNGERVRVSDIENAEDAYANMSSAISFERKGLTTQLLNIEQNIAHSRSMGAIWAYHLLARGNIDMVIELKNYLWDMAAPKIIIEEAGGKVTNLEGSEKIQNATQAVVATNGNIHNEVLKLLR